MAIANGALRSCFESLSPSLGSGEGQGRALQKTMVRSFAWCPPLKVPGERFQRGGAYFVPDGASRWGVQVLEVTNDDNDVVFLRVHESSPFSFEVLTMTSLCDLGGDDPVSLFSSALKTQIKTLSVACGPWLPADAGPGVYSVTSNVAVAHGKTLNTIKLNVELTRQDGYQTVAKCEENTVISKHIQDCDSVTGPFQWVHTVRTNH